MDLLDFFYELLESLAGFSDVLPPKAKCFFRLWQSYMVGHDSMWKYDENMQKSWVFHKIVCLNK